MTKLTWDEIPERVYENGVSMGVLYPAETDLEYFPGVAWGGLISVAEESSNKDITTEYYDGVTHINKAMNSVYRATIVAFSIPNTFLGCLGEKEIAPGVILPNQKRSRVGFCYRTEVTGGYKLHLVYNAYMYRTKRAHSTLSDTPSPEILEFVIMVNTDNNLSDVRTTGHYIFDSRRTPSSVLGQMENLLYGNTWLDPLLISPEMILDLY